MNTRQRIVILAGSALLILAVLFPPMDRLRSREGAYVWAGRRTADLQDLSINTAYLALELLVIVAVTGALFFVLRDWNPLREGAGKIKTKDTPKKPRLPDTERTVYIRETPKSAILS